MYLVRSLIVSNTGGDIDNPTNTSSTIDISYTKDNYIASYDEHFKRYNEGGGTTERSFVYKFNYSGDQCHVVRTIDGGESEVETYYFNKDNTLSRIEGKDGTLATFSYKDGCLEKWNGRTYTWEDGNIASMTDESGHQYIFEYYNLDNPFNDIVDWTVDVGAILPGDPFGYGFVGKRNEKLLKRVSGNGVSYQWTYSYDKVSVRLANFVRVFTSEDSNNAMLQEVVFGY